MQLESYRSKIFEALNATTRSAKEARLVEIESEIDEQQRLRNVAQEEGDLRENAAYTLACSNLQRLEKEKGVVIGWLGTIDSFSKMYTPSGIIGIGSTVRLNYQKSEKTIMIVPSELGDAKLGAVSIKSAVGTKLIGKEVGDTITVQVNAKTSTYTVLEVY